MADLEIEVTPTPTSSTLDVETIPERDAWRGPLLEVRNLSVSFPTDDGLVHAVDDLSFVLRDDEVLGIVGESGSGKTVTSLAILGLLPKSAQVAGEILFCGRDLVGLKERDMTPLRGNRVAMVFQDALAALNPVMTVGWQIAEAITVHREMEKRDLDERVAELLGLVGIPNPRERATQYPHEYSGGMRQRAMIAMSIANDPDVLIADEPTTALDVTIQAQVLDVLERVAEKTSSSILLITHDLGVVAGVADRVMVMYAGREAELGTVEELFYQPAHPYTQGLLASLPRIDRRESDKLHRIFGQPPSLIYVPSGCPFHPRCPEAELPGVCNTERPALIELSMNHLSACHFAERLLSEHDQGRPKSE
ncbi:MAG: ABC transporter ATP-binding protein [Acidimicrobiales bacterium]